MSQEIDEDEDIVISELSDEGLTEQMHDDLYDGLAEEIAVGTQILQNRDRQAKQVLNEALVAGMNVAGDIHDIGKNLVGMMTEGAGLQGH